MNEYLIITTLFHKGREFNVYKNITLCCASKSSDYYNDIKNKLLNEHQTDISIVDMSVLRIKGTNVSIIGGYE